MTVSYPDKYSRAKFGINEKSIMHIIKCSDMLDYSGGLRERGGQAGDV